MEDNFTIEIISPEKKIFSDNKIQQAIIPAYEGEMGILKNHIPIISFLKPGIIKIIKQSENENNFLAEDGIVEFHENCLTILSSKIINTKNIKKEEINQLISETENNIDDQKLDDQEKYLASHKLDVLRSLILN